MDSRSSRLQAEFKKPLPKDRLTPSRMFDFAFSKVLQAVKEFPEELRTTIINPVAGESVYGAEFAVSDQSVLLMSPASDDEKNNGRNTGTTPLPLILARIRKLQEKKPKQKFILPLAECQDMLMGLTYRQHWTILLIEEDSCYFYDPCSASLTAFSGSTFYSLEPIKKFLEQAGFKLTNVTYLGWQHDNYNCGRFCSAIAATIAESVFTKKVVSNVTTILQNLSAPIALKLEEESSVSQTDRRIVGNRAIIEARAQGFYDKKMKFKELNQGNKKSDNKALEFLVSNDGFVNGDDEKSEISRDYLSRRDRIYIEDQALADFIADEEIDAALLAKKLDCSAEVADSIIKAHSVKIFNFLPEMLENGIKQDKPLINFIKSANEPVKYKIFKKGDEIKLICEYRDISLYSIEHARNVGVMEGTTKVSYDLQKKAGKWGWKLKTIDSENADILKIFSGELLPVEYIQTHYCRMSPVVNKKVQAQQLPVQVAISQPDVVREPAEVKLPAELVVTVQPDPVPMQPKLAEALQPDPIVVPQPQPPSILISPPVLSLPNEALHHSVPVLQSARDEEILSPPPQNTSKWKYALVGLGLLLGVAGLFSGIGSLAGLAFLSMSTAIAATLIAGSGLTTIGITGLAVHLYRQKKSLPEVSAAISEKNNKNEREKVSVVVHSLFQPAQKLQPSQNSSLFSKFFPCFRKA